MLEVTLGKPFPDNRYISDYDSLIPRINANAFDIILTLNDLTETELMSITSDAFEVRLFFFCNVPHMVIRFSNGNIHDFSINVRLIKSVPIPTWISSPSTTVGIYLLKPITGEVLSIRFFDYPYLRDFKNLLTYQYDMAKEEVPNCIAIGEKMFSPMDMFQKGTLSAVIPEVEVIL